MVPWTVHPQDHQSTAHTASPLYRMGSVLAWKDEWVKQNKSCSIIKEMSSFMELKEKLYVVSCCLLYAVLKAIVEKGLNI